MAFGGEFDNGDEVMSEINMTPLVDVMLVLLIIFIIAIPMMTNAIKLDLPRAAASPDDIKPERVTLSVMVDGTTHWNDTPVDNGELALLLEKAAAQQPQPEIAIRGDRKSEYERVIQVMATAQRAGIQKLGFITELSGN